MVNTNGREHLLACLDAIERTHHAGVSREILVLDNASSDGSAEAVRASGHDVRLMALNRRSGKAANDSRLLQEAAGRFCLLLNEDAELCEGAARARLLLVGEQPGDKEDLAGEPFVGPAGRLLDEALAEAGIDRSEAYLTNVVKHFKWQARGKRRIHQKPNWSEIAACRLTRSRNCVRVSRASLRCS